METAQVLLIVANVALVLVTGWYAISTSRMVGELKTQHEQAAIQNRLQAKSTEILAQAALMQAAGHPDGSNPIPRLRQLAEEIREMRL